MSTPPSDDQPDAPKPRRAATERAMRRRERRLAKSPTDRNAPRERNAPHDRTSPRERNAPVASNAPHERISPHERNAPLASNAPHDRTSPHERNSPLESSAPGESNKSRGRTGTRDRNAPLESNTPRESSKPRDRTGARDRPPRDRTTGRARPPRDRRARRVRRDSEDRSGFPTRRRALVRRWTAVAIVMAAVGLMVVVLWTPLFGVRSVDVVGVRDLTTAQVLKAADVRPGTPMLRLDTVGIMTRVGLLPRVASVDVSRDWPSTVRIDIVERDPVGILARPDGTHLIDSTGFDYATVTTAPAGLPKIDLPSASPADPRTLSVVHVLAALPTQLRAQLGVIGAATPGSVTLTLANGKIIRWGDADDSARKAAVLGALMTRPGKIYDVSSPDLPTIS